MTKYSRTKKINRRGPLFGPGAVTFLPDGSVRAVLIKFEKWIPQLPAVGEGDDVLKRWACVSDTEERPMHLVGTKEIANLMGLKRVQGVHHWKNRYPDFPKPIGELSKQDVWDLSQILAWKDHHERLKNSEPEDELDTTYDDARHIPDREDDGDPTSWFRMMATTISSLRTFQQSEISRLTKHQKVIERFLREESARLNNGLEVLKRADTDNAKNIKKKGENSK
jgi:predicted DNA-binding transcriptional regulator AlpA